MFDIGFLELLVLAIIGLLVLGPERLPEAVRAISLWVGRLRRGFDNLRNEIEREIGTDEIKRQLHNEKVMENLKKTQQELKDTQQQLQRQVTETDQQLRRLPDEATARGDEAADDNKPSQSSDDESQPAQRPE